MDTRDLRRLELLRLRVGRAPIDVTFGWDNPLQAEVIGDVSCLIFQAISEMHSQWKTVVLHVMGGVKRGWKVEEVFKCSQWPLLESLSFIGDIPCTEIPAAPLLGRMWLRCGFNQADELLVVETCPALTTLGIQCEYAPSLQRLGPALGLQLVELVLMDNPRYFIDKLGPASTLGVFTVLQCLSLYDTRWLHHIEAPALKKLVLTTRYIDYVDPEALRRLHHVQELKLLGYFMTSELAGLKDLSHVKTLAFDTTRYLTKAFEYGIGVRRINSMAVRDLVTIEPPIWPHLERLHFSAALFPGRGSNETAQDVVDFVAMRNARAAGSDEPVVARIIEVVANHAGAPEWLGEKLREITTR